MASRARLDGLRRRRVHRTPYRELSLDDARDAQVAAVISARQIVEILMFTKYSRTHSAPLASPAYSWLSNQENQENQEIDSDLVEHSVLDRW